MKQILVFAFLTINYLLLAVNSCNALTTTVYLGGYEKDLETKVKRVYLPAGNSTVLKTISNGGSSYSYLHSDYLGSTSLITDKSGNITNSLVYAPFGTNQLVTSNSQLVTDNLYTGQKRDSSDSLYYYNARYYNPTTAHFISSDPAQGMNRYAYVGNNPVMRNDPSGNMKDDPEKNSKPPYPNNYNRPTSIKITLKLQEMIKKTQENTLKDPRAKHAFLNAANQADFEREYLPALVNEVHKEFKYSKYYKGDDDYSLAQAFLQEYGGNYNLPYVLPNNIGVCANFAAYTMLAAEDVVPNVTVVNYKLDHAYNISKNGVVFDSTWNVTMPLAKHAQWLNYNPSKLNVYSPQPLPNQSSNVAYVKNQYPSNGREWPDAKYDWYYNTNLNSWLENSEKWEDYAYSWDWSTMLPLSNLDLYLPTRLKN